MRKIAFTFLFTFFYFITFAQLEKPVKWSYFAIQINKTEAVVYLKVKLEGKWHIYSQQIEPVAMKTKFAFATSKDFILIGKTIEPKSIKKYDKTVKMDLTYFEKEAVFTQKIKLKKIPTTVKGKIEFTVCNDKSCLPANDITFSVLVK